MLRSPSKLRDRAPCATTRIRILVTTSIVYALLPDCFVPRFHLAEVSYLVNKTYRTATANLRFS